MLIMAGLKDVRREQGANAQEKYFHPQGITLISIFAAIAILLAAGLAYPGQSSSAEEPAADTSGNASLVLAGGGDFGGGVAVHSLSRATLSAGYRKGIGAGHPFWHRPGGWRGGGRGASGAGRHNFARYRRFKTRICHCAP
jgi:hypothetical protein